MTGHAQLFPRHLGRRESPGGVRRSPRAVRGSGVVALVAGLLALAPAASAGWGGDPSGNLADLRAFLIGCTGTPAAPYEVALTADLTDTSTELVVGCAARIDLAGHHLAVRDIVVTTGSALEATDTTAGAGSLTADATGMIGAAGIQTTGASLTTAGTARLTATGGDGGAGIGGGSGGDGGTTTSNDSSTITATGGPGGAGIGGGSGGAGGSTTSNDSSTITATGGSGASAVGIGAGGTPAAGTFLHVAAGTLNLGSDLAVADADSSPSTAEVEVGTQGVIARTDPASTAAITGTGTIANGGAITLPTTAVGPTAVTDHHYRVTFDTQAGSPAPGDVLVFADTFTHGARALPPEPTKGGFEFAGWNTAADGTGTTIEPGTPLPGTSTDGTAAPVEVYARYRPIPVPPVVWGLQPTISGVAQVGQVLHAGSGSVQPSTADLAYVWQADGTPITGADDPTLTLTPALEGAVVTVTITASAPGFLPDTETSAPTAPVLPADPDPVSALTPPDITGHRWFDAVLTASEGTWTGDPTTISFQWLRDETPIPGAVAAEYSTTLDDIGHVVSLRVTASQSSTNVATVAVDAGQIGLAPMAWESSQSLQITGTPRPGEKLRSSIRGVALLQGAEPDATTVTYGWLRDGKRISNSDHPTYRARHRDGGHRLVLTVTLSRLGHWSVVLRTTPVRVRR